MRTQYNQEFEKFLNDVAPSDSYEDNEVVRWIIRKLKELTEGIAEEKQELKYEKNGKSGDQEDEETLAEG